VKAVILNLAASRFIPRTTGCELMFFQRFLLSFLAHTTLPSADDHGASRNGLPYLCFYSGMLILPSTEDSLLVRTTFGNEDAWVDALSSVLSENEDGFRAYVKVVDDIAWDRVGWEQVRQAALAGNQYASVLFIVDSAALESGYPIQVIDLSKESRRPFRCIARELWGVDNNLNIANMDWEEFAESTDNDGVFRGFA
jgi:hypothetical protein